MVVDQSEAEADECVAEPTEDYNMPFRVGSLFIILVTSAVGKLSIVSIVGILGPARLTLNHRHVYSHYFTSHPTIQSRKYP